MDKDFKEMIEWLEKLPEISVYIDGTYDVDGYYEDNDYDDYPIDSEEDLQMISNIRFALKTLNKIKDYIKKFDHITKIGSPEILDFIKPLRKYLEAEERLRSLKDVLK